MTTAWRPSGWTPATPAPTEPATPVRDDLTLVESPYLIEGWAHRWHPEYGTASPAIRVAYAVADQFGWAVMARRGRHVVTVARADHRVAKVARDRAVAEVEHLTAGWRPGP